MLITNHLSEAKLHNLILSPKRNAFPHWK
uniref:Uncharacterized protein n=1 Tax=Anguilla anguilla TaxID=7936 RepID=A0A0E9XNJ0_ANGAN